MYEDEALQDIYDEMYREEDKSPTGFSRLDSKSKFWIGIFVGVLILLVYLGRITVVQGLVIGGIGALILYLMKGTTKQRNELTWLECMLRIHDLLDFLQKHPIGGYPQIPEGEIRVRPVGRKQWYDGRPFKRSFSVNIYDNSLDVEEMYFVEVDVFNGDILSFKEAPMGVTGDETKDLKVIASPELRNQMLRENMMKRNK